MHNAGRMEHTKKSSRTVSLSGWGEKLCFSKDTECNLLSIFFNALLMKLEKGLHAVNHQRDRDSRRISIIPSYSNMWKDLIKFMFGARLVFYGAKIFGSKAGRGARGRPTWRAWKANIWQIIWGTAQWFWIHELAEAWNVTSFRFIHCHQPSDNKARRKGISPAAPADVDLWARKIIYEKQ